MSFKAICSLDQIWRGEMMEVEVDGKPVLLIHTDAGHLAATQARCPHQSVALCEGRLEGQTLTCRVHLWQFDVVTGAGINPRHAKLALFPVRVDNNEVLVDVDAIDAEFAHS